VVQLIVENKKIKGVLLKDGFTGEEIAVHAKVVINATGVFVDHVMQMDLVSTPKMISPSQGVHLVVDRKFFSGDAALMVPKTSDGRVLFIVPWHNQLVIGTTDTLVDHLSEEPQALATEINFILTHFNKYAVQPITEKDIKSVYAGLRPLVKTSNISATALLSREHTIIVSAKGLITIAGGKWTTYRKMAKDVVQNAIFIGKLEKRKCITQIVEIHGFSATALEDDVYTIYGTDARLLKLLIEQEPALAKRLHAEYPYTQAQVVWAVREEMALTVEDVLSRRIRLLIEDARAAMEVAPVVAELMAKELGKGSDWADLSCKNFMEVAQQYIIQ
jgi:glycerol-3-phosphate dehydrogenase